MNEKISKHNLSKNWDSKKFKLDSTILGHPAWFNNYKIICI